MKIIFKNLLLISVFGLITACDSNDKDKKYQPPNPTTVFDVAAANDNFDTLVAALEATGLDDTLDNPNQTFTVFAPTDAAFALLGEDTINALLQDTDTLSSILLYHVIAGAEVKSTAAIASAGTSVATANGASIALSLSGDNLLINLATVTMVDIEADNGVIHVIDAVLTPPTEEGEPAANIVETAVAAGTFNTLVAAVQAAGLDDLLADETETFTVFAPTDAAFEKLGDETINALLADIPTLTQILLHHVIRDTAVNSITAFTLNGESALTAGNLPIAIEIVDGELLIEGSKVTTFDIYTSNGIIHVIDTVITSSLE
jgi:transforming growth factor-beta-induced protein